MLYILIHNHQTPDIKPTIT